LIVIFVIFLIKILVICFHGNANMRAGGLKKLQKQDEKSALWRLLPMEFGPFFAIFFLKEDSLLEILDCPFL